MIPSRKSPGWQSSLSRLAAAYASTTSYALVMLTLERLFDGAEVMRIAGFDSYGAPVLFGKWRD
jgi:hypothetical protein